MDEYPTCDGSTMKTARRASWTSATSVANPDTTLSPRGQAASSSTTIDRVMLHGTTSTTTNTAISAAASQESVNPTPAANPNIPAAIPRAEATRTRIIL